MLFSKNLKLFTFYLLAYDDKSPALEAQQSNTGSSMPYLVSQKHLSKGYSTLLQRLNTRISELDDQR